MAQDVAARTCFVALLEPIRELETPDLEASCRALEGVSFREPQGDDRGQSCWERVAMPGDLADLRGRAAELVDSSVARFSLASRWRNEVHQRATWLLAAPEWAVEEPALADLLLLDGGKKHLAVKIDDLSAFAFPTGLLALVLDMRPFGALDAASAAPSLETMNLLRRGHVALRRTFQDPRQRQAVSQRAGSDAETPWMAALCGAKTPVWDIVTSLAPAGYRPAEQRLQPFSFLLTSRAGDDDPFSTAEDMALFLISSGMSRDYHFSAHAVAATLYQDEREHVRFCVTPRGVGCWTKWTDEKFLRSGAFESKLFSMYFWLFLWTHYQRHHLRQLRETLSVPRDPQRLPPIAEQARYALLDASEDSPSAEDFHSRFYGQLRAVTGLESLGAEVMERLDRARELAVDTAGPAPSFEPTPTRPLEPQHLGQILQDTAGWFEGNDLEPDTGRFPHNFVPERHPAQVHMETVRAQFPWMPESWWRTPEAIHNLHQALKTMLGTFSCTVGTAGVRAPSVTAMYILLCHSLWATVGNAGVRDLLVAPERLAAIQNPQVPFLPLQPPAHARETLAYLEAFLADFLVARGPTPTRLTNVRKLSFGDGSGRTLRVDLTFRCDGLRQRMDAVVNRVLSGASIPGLGSATVALLRFLVSSGRSCSGAGPLPAVELSDMCMVLRGYDS